MPGTPIQFRAEREDPWVGTVAAEIQAEYVTGEGPRTLADSKGRVVVVEFWATFCDPCRRSFPRYQALRDRFGDSIAVIAISLDSPTDQDAAALQRFASETGVSFPILWDKDGSMRSLYHPPSLPTSFIIAKDGSIAHAHVKYEAGDADIIAKEIEGMLSEGEHATP